MNANHQWFERAKKYIPGGVNSPVRAFNAVGGEPLFIEKGDGAYIWDAQGNAYIDYVGSWGPLILGHCHPKVVKAVEMALHKGMSFGAPTRLEVEMAECIQSLVPNAEMVRMVNSGTEATMTAIRLARGFTQRDKIIKFEGCYHGHSDSLLAKAGSGLLTLGLPSSPGIPQSIAEHTLTANFNQLSHVEELLEHYRGQVAAIILEPVAGNMGCILPQDGFLQGLRKLCDEHQVLLIFDEVMTGFRVALGGAQSYFGVDADLITLGKIIGGGMPVGCITGKRAIMEHLAPMGPVYQAGTLSGNPLAMTAGLQTLKELSSPGCFESLCQHTTRLVDGIKSCADEEGIPMVTSQAGAMFGLCFSQADALVDYKQVCESNINRFNEFFHAMLKQGVYLAPSAYEAGFVSCAHTDEDIDKTIAATQHSLRGLSL